MDLTWYSTLVKPALNPPSWIFGPVWTLLYILMAVSAVLILRQGWQHKRVRVALGVFLLQLILNLIWSPIFFGWHKIGWALADILAIWISVIWTIKLFHKIYKPAAYLLLPYILWVSFAMYLNFTIWTLN